jgi:4-hydroxy-2-oxoheptanedioate aldolase
MASIISSLLHKVARGVWQLPAAILVLAAIAATPAAGQTRLSQAISALESGKVAVGTIINSNVSLAAIEALRALPLDWVFIDLEHAAYEWPTVRSVIANFRAPDGSFPVTPIVRIPPNCSEAKYNQWIFKQVLDGGAFGAVVAHCDTPEDVNEAAVAMRFPPFLGEHTQRVRGVRGSGGAAGVWGISGLAYAQRADLWPLDPDGELLLVPMVESVQSVNKLNSILRMPGVGAAFIGPNDLHYDMGYGGQSGVPEVEAVIQRALRAAQQAGVPIGITTFSAAELQARIDQGFRFLTINTADLAGALAAIGR